MTCYKKLPYEAEYKILKVFPAIFDACVAKIFTNNICIFTFSYPCNGRESIVFGSNFRNGDIDGFTRYEGSETENHNFSFWSE